MSIHSSKLAILTGFLFFCSGQRSVFAQDTSPLPFFVADNPVENPDPAPSEGDEEETISPEEEQGDINYIITPRVVDEDRVPLIFTTFPLNGFSLNHKLDFNLETSYQTGENSSSNLFLDAVYKIDGSTVQSLTRDNVFTSDYRATYGRVRTLNQGRDISITFTEPQTMVGFGIQQTFSGDCSIVGVVPQNPNSQCSFLPALVTDRSSFDEDLQPRRIEQRGNIGQEITPENLAILSLPGFQNRGINGETFGLDLVFPNVGRFPGNSLGDETFVERREEFNNTLAGGIYRTRQVVRTNADEAVLGRTIYGGNVILEDNNFILNTVVGALAQFLPEIDPALQGTEQSTNTAVHQNLFLAANNARIPRDSLVMYHGGVGKIDHPSLENIQNISEYKPVGTFNGVWLGLSPVRTRSLDTTTSINFINDQIRGGIAGGEGGANTNISFVTAANENVINSAGLTSFYIQAYLSLFERDINFVTRQVLSEQIDYFPHLSLTGNITKNNQVVRYYTGAIASDNPKFYLGADYVRVMNGWRFDLSSIYYINPDQDYFSKVESSLNKGFQINPNLRIGFSTAFRYAFDRDVENILEQPTDNFFSIGTNINWNKVNLNISQLFDVFPDSVGNKLQASVNFPLADNITLGAFITPQRNIDNYGLALSLSQNNSRFGMSWNRRIFSYGEDVFGRDLETTDNVYQLFFRTSL